jgi:tetratricopeptide (TPR) repeat protein
LHGLVALLFRRAGIPRRHTSTAAIAAAAILAATAVSVLFLARDRIEEREMGQGRPAVRYVVLDYAAPDASDTEISLSMQAARALRDLLDGWRSVSVVPEAAMEGPAAELFTAGVAPSSYALGTGLAERFDADYRVQVQVRNRDRPGSSESVTRGAEQTIQVNATLFQKSRDRLIDTFDDEGPVDSIGPIMIGIAMNILDLQGDVEDWELLRARSSDHRAVAAFDSARIALWSWRLAEAHRLLEASLERDSIFALAHHLLAETMYWEMARDDERLFELGPRIEFHSAQAERFGAGRLRPTEREAVVAFRAFWRGDYEGARDRYDRLIEHNPHDLEMLVMRGAIEVEDPILVNNEIGEQLPRSNLNVAHRMFDTAMALNQDWELARGHLLEIDRMVIEAAYLRQRGVGFQERGSGSLTPYAKRETVDQVYFCPVYSDSIAWRRLTSSGCPIDSASRATAETLHRQTMNRLEWLAEVYQNQPRHYEELGSLLLWERSLPGCDADPIRSDSLFAAAYEHFQRAFQIREARGDSATPQLQARLANLHLGVGEFDAAIEIGREVLELLPEWKSLRGTPPPSATANPFLAAGEAETAAEIAESIWGRNSVSLQADDGRWIDAQGQYGRLLALEALGASGTGGRAVTDRLVLLRRSWQSKSLSGRDRVALRKAALPYVGLALVHVPAHWRGWFEDWEKYDLEIPALWKGLFAAHSDPPDHLEARERLEESLAEAGVRSDPVRVRATDLYLPILLAQRIGADDVEARLMDRLSRCPLRLDAFEPGWGVMRVLSGAD